MAPALLSPVLMTAATDSVFAQTPTASQAIADKTPAVDDQFVLDWLNYAANNADDFKLSTRAYTEALRARKLLNFQGKTLDPKVEKRRVEVGGLLQQKGLTRQHIEEAVNQLGGYTAAPKAAAAPTNAVAAVPPLPALPGQAVKPNTGPAAQLAPSMQLPVGPTVGPSANPNMGPGAIPSTGHIASDAVTPGVFWPGQDATQNQAASGQIALAPATAMQDMTSGEALYTRGLELLSQGDREAALEAFRQAWKFEGEMDVTLRGQLKDKLSSMSNLDRGPEQIPATPLNQAAQAQLRARQKMMTEVSAEISAAEANREQEPNVVAQRLQTLRTRVSQADLDGQSRKQMLTLVDRQIATHQIYMSQNQAAIDQNMRNRQVEEQMSLEAESNYKVQQQIASLVDTYHDLMDEGRYPEAEGVAKQVGVLDRGSEIAALLIANARNRRRILENEDILLAKEDGFIDSMLDVDRAATPYPDAAGMTFPKDWNELSRNRLSRLENDNQGMTPQDAMIYERLKQPVMVDFQNRPLSEVIGVLQNLVGIPIVVDEQGLAREGLGNSSEIPVTLSLPSQIQLRSALNLMLGSDLGYQVRDEVLVISSARNNAKANRTITYNVKDLVTPIPNFIHDHNSGMAGAIRNAYETVAAGRGLMAMAERGVAPQNPVQFASASVDPNTPALGQLGGGNLPPQFAGGLLGGGGGSGPQFGSSAPMSMGSPNGIGGGAAQADFDTLMNLIQQTIEPDSWLAAGGQSTMLQYPANLSIVVSAPQTTHEKIAELLESLRRLQDLQVTIEVKFITLNDNFFERMGVDFDVKVDDNVRTLPQDDAGNSTVVGLNASVNPFGPTLPIVGDLDVTFSQDNFTSAVPSFAFDSGSGGSLGFAILSDLELFFFMNAAQGDSRTNVLQAPRVTMFDGQFASIVDTVNRPFVTGLIPVVGDFAVAQQPVIVVINEGTILNVQATVTADKRFVRMTLNPTFTQIDRVDTFTFEGTRTTRSGTNVLDPAGEVTGDNDNVEEIITGSTVQQPSLVTTNISTTVSVPDGGTILLGGIKRMREGRTERGIPILSKIPYVNRLFKNTAIGRETSTLMMTVTPRIIIQEEEEEKYGVVTP